MDKSSLFKKHMTVTTPATMEKIETQCKTSNNPIMSECRNTTTTATIATTPQTAKEWGASSTRVASMQSAPQQPPRQDNLWRSSREEQAMAIRAHSDDPYSPGVRRADKAGQFLGEWEAGWEQMGVKEQASAASTATATGTTSLIMKNNNKNRRQKEMERDPAGMVGLNNGLAELAIAEELEVDMEEDDDKEEWVIV